MNTTDMQEQVLDAWMDSIEEGGGAEMFLRNVLRHGLVRTPVCLLSRAELVEELQEHNRWEDEQ